ncbi:unnamed protein product [Chrysoparadoxa australica]
MEEGKKDGEARGTQPNLVVTLDPALKTEIFPRTSAAYVTTRRKRRIPLLLFRAEANPLAEYTLIYSHGNATDIGETLLCNESALTAKAMPHWLQPQWLPRFYSLTCCSLPLCYLSGAMYGRCSRICDTIGCSVVIYDYTGYGCSSGGRPSEADTYTDIEAVLAWVIKQAAHRDTGRRVVLYGQSVGSGPSCHLAAMQIGCEYVQGLILHSPIMSGLRVLTSSRALGCVDIYPNISRITKVKCPVMIMHGKRDEEVPWEHGVELWKATPPSLRREPWWAELSGHNDMADTDERLEEYLRRLRIFMQGLHAAEG